MISAHTQLPRRTFVIDSSVDFTPVKLSIPAPQIAAPLTRVGDAISWNIQSIKVDKLGSFYPIPNSRTVDLS